MNQDQLDNVLLQLRKIREALTSTRSKDEFAVQVYILSLDVALRSTHYAEAAICLNHLVHQLYDGENEDDLWTELFGCHVLYLCLSAFLRQESLNEAFVFVFKSPFKLLDRERPLIREAWQLGRELHIGFNYWRFWKFYAVAHGRMQLLLEMVVEEVRKKSLEVLRKSYYSLSLRDLTLMLHEQLPSTQETKETFLERYRVPSTHFVDDVVYFKRPRK